MPMCAYVCIIKGRFLKYITETAWSTIKKKSEKKSFFFNFVKITAAGAHKWHVGGAATNLSVSYPRENAVV